MIRFALVLCVLLTGCPPKDLPTTADAGAASGVCSKIGQSCEFSPGKLGTCVQDDTCKTASVCFTCQSQH